MIPKVMHRIWLGSNPMPPAFEDYWKRLQELHPGWQFKTWTDKSDLRFMRNRKCFDGMPTYSGKSDVLRIELIARYGGLYVDCDMEPLKPFDGLLRGIKAFAAWEDERYIAWGVFGAERGHPAVLALRSRLPVWSKAHEHEPANVRSGPVFLTAVWKRRRDVTILPTPTFYPVSWSDRRRVKPPYPSGAYAVHHWAESWKSAADHKRDVQLEKLEKDARGIFSAFYRDNTWGGLESKSGPGSSLEATAILRRVLPELAEGLRVRRVLDAACGDSFWMPELPGYVGVDIVPEAVRRAKRRHSRRRYRVVDVRSGPLPRADLVICRDAMMHLPLADGIEALNAIRKTGATWLAATTFDTGKNVNVKTGGFYRIDLEAKPFALGKPWMVLEDDRYPNPDGWKSEGKLLGVWALA